MRPRFTPSLSRLVNTISHTHSYRVSSRAPSSVSSPHPAASVPGHPTASVPAPIWSQRSARSRTPRQRSEVFHGSSNRSGCRVRVRWRVRSDRGSSLGAGARGAERRTTPKPAAKWTPPRTPVGRSGSPGHLEQRHDHAARARPRRRREGTAQQARGRGTQRAVRRARDRRKTGRRTRPRIVALAYDQFWWDRGASIGRTSLIVDPKDGRLPPLTAAGPEAARRAARRGARGRGRVDSWTDRPLQERCIMYHGVPPLPTGYNNNYEITQAPGVVAILHEEIHEVRLIPLDGRPHAGAGDPSVAGRFARPLGRRHARRRDDELPAGRDVQVSRRSRHAPRHRALPPRRAGRHRLPVHGREPDVLFTRPWTATLPMRPERRADLRIRLPRGQLRHRARARGATAPRKRGRSGEAARK